jgi:hypothetical protein
MGPASSDHTHLEFIAFLKSLARHPPKLEQHLICDHYGTHKHPAVKHWLAVHPRFDSVARLEQAITRFLANWNENAQPFRWTKSAHQIKRSIRNAALIYGTLH